MNRQKITKAFSKTNLSTTYGDGWVNIMSPDGMHCEFYGDGDTRNDLTHLTATYTMRSKKPEELFFDLTDEDQLFDFVETVQFILRPLKKKEVNS